MSFKVGVGKSDFEALRKSDDYYVDKTDILYELVEEKDNQVTLFTRPRRFGKTLMMSMMSNFFSITKDGRAIFEGLKITEYKEFCGKWMNRYPVLSFRSRMWRRRTLRVPMTCWKQGFPKYVSNRLL